MRNSLLKNSQVIIRSLQERTEELCRFSVQKNGISEKQIKVIHNVYPFSKCLEIGYKQALQNDYKYTFFIDADMVVFSGALETMLQAAESSSNKTFFVNPLVYDYTTGLITPNGPHLYRTKLLEEALNYIPSDQESRRPESFVTKEMQKVGYSLQYLDMPLALHEFEQSYHDLFIKAYKKFFKFKRFRFYIEKRIEKNYSDSRDFWLIKKSWELASSENSLSQSELEKRYSSLNLKEKDEIENSSEAYSKLINNVQQFKNDFIFSGYSSQLIEKKDDGHKEVRGNDLFQKSKTSLRKLLNLNRKKNRFYRKVYPGENIFDRIIDFFPFDDQALKDPMFVIGCARAGTSLSFSFLEASEEVACLYEANKKWMHFFKKQRDENDRGDLLTVSQAKPKVVRYLRTEFNKYRKRERKKFFAEKDPRNSIRMDFLKKVFPDAKIIFVYRNPYDNICSLIKRHDKARKKLSAQKKDGQWWRSGDAWAEQRIPGWKELREKPLVFAACKQYKFTIEKAMKDLQNFDDDKILKYKFEDILLEPKKFQKKLYDFCGLNLGPENKKVIDTIRKPNSEHQKELSSRDIQYINQECESIFKYFAYSKLNPNTNESRE